MSTGHDPAQAIVNQPGAPIAMAGLRRRAIPYLLIRLTGVLLAVLVGGHFIIVHFANDVTATNASFVAKRWGQGLWIGWDSLMFAAALVHGGIGMSNSLADYTIGRRRRLIRGSLAALTVALFVYGLVVIALGVGT